MMRFSSELLVCNKRALGRATAIATILFTFNVVTTNAQDFEPEELQPQSPSGSPSSPPSSSLLTDDDIMSDNRKEIMFNSTEIYDATDRATNISTTITSFLDKSASTGKLSLRWLNITEIVARALHIFNTECRPNEIALTGTWIVGSAQYLPLLQTIHLSRKKGNNLAPRITFLG